MNRAAGSFGDWLGQMRAVLRGEREADVPCDGCVGCCVSSYPVPLRPGDQVALALVPAQHLQWSANGGAARMLHRADGTCPMLDSGRCTIYADRPQTCRDYDCRIYAAAGLLPDGERPLIHQRVQSWHFDCDSARDQAAAAAVRQSAQFIRDHAELFPRGMRASAATAAAVLAVKTYELFLSADCATTAPQEMVRSVIEAALAFDQRSSGT